MGRRDFHPYGRNARIFDLSRGFDDPLLSDGGELELVVDKSTDVAQMYRERSIDIGRESTPSLDLPMDVSRRHLQLRFGVLGRSLRLMDLNSTNGTMVALHPLDQQFIVCPPKEYMRTPFGLMPSVRIEGRWVRPTEQPEDPTSIG